MCSTIMIKLAENEKKKYMKKKKKAAPRIELGARESKPRMLTITPCSQLGTSTIPPKYQVDNNEKKKIKILNSEIVWWRAK